jgi:hypothetical protein
MAKSQRSSRKKALRTQRAEKVSSETVGFWFFMSAVPDLAHLQLWYPWLLLQQQQSSWWHPQRSERHKCHHMHSRMYYMVFDGMADTP